MAWIPRDVKDQLVQYPNRFKINGVPGQTIEPDFGVVSEPGTDIGRAYLQPIEDFLGQVTTKKIVQGTYTGTGTHGASNPNILVFDITPDVVLIVRISGTGSALINNETLFVRPATNAYQTIGSASTAGDTNNIITWGANSVSWYTTYSGGGSGAIPQKNVSDAVYAYIVLGE